MKEFVEYGLGGCGTCGGNFFAIKSDEEICVCCDECGSIYLNPGFACISENISRLDLLKNINFQEVSFEEIINKGWGNYVSVRMFGEKEWITYKEWSGKK